MDQDLRPGARNEPDQRAENGPAATATACVSGMTARDEKDTEDTEDDQDAEDDEESNKNEVDEEEDEEEDVYADLELELELDEEEEEQKKRPQYDGIDDLLKKTVRLEIPLEEAGYFSFVEVAVSGETGPRDVQESTGNSQEDQGKDGDVVEVPKHTPMYQKGKLDSVVSELEARYGNIKMASVKRKRGVRQADPHALAPHAPGDAGPKRKRKPVHEWYDVNDPFIDDTELFEERSYKKTMHGGFFINVGDILDQPKDYFGASTLINFGSSRVDVHQPASELPAIGSSTGSAGGILNEPARQVPEVGLDDPDEGDEPGGAGEEEQESFETLQARIAKAAPSDLYALVAVFMDATRELDFGKKYLLPESVYNRIFDVYNFMQTTAGIDQGLMRDIRALVSRRVRLQPSTIAMRMSQKRNQQLFDEIYSTFQGNPEDTLSLSAFMSKLGPLLSVKKKILMARNKRKRQETAEEYAERISQCMLDFVLKDGMDLFPGSITIELADIKQWEEHARAATI